MSGHIKKEDFELYRFFFSKENLNPSKVSKRVQMILDYRYADKMTFKAISAMIAGVTDSLSAK